MFDTLEPYQRNGHFFFNKGDLLTKVSENVPELHGVYYFLRLARGKVDVVYIGHSGRIDQQGNFADQTLRGRINNKQGSIKRQQFFDQKMEEETIDALDIYWFVTYDEKHQDLPAYVKAILM